MNTQWQQFTRKITINASKKEVYDYWTIPNNIEKWFLESAVFISEKGQKRNGQKPIQPNDTYAWKWFGHENYIANGMTLELNGIDFIKFTFEGCIVSVTIKEKDDFVVTEITQSEIDFNENPNKNLHVQCSNGWTFYLANLKSILEGGIDLRNKINNLNVVNS